MGAGREWANISRGVNVQADAGAPSESVVFVIALYRFNGWSECDFRHAFERFAQDLSLERALVVQLDVPELSAARAVVWIAIDTRGRPHMLAAMFARSDDLDRLSAPERFLVVIGDACKHAFPRDRVGNEYDTAIVARNADTPVRNVGNVYFDHSA
jgi:hypothetical protein